MVACSSQKETMVVVESFGGSHVASLTPAKGGLLISSEAKVLRGDSYVGVGKFSSQQLLTPMESFFEGFEGSV